MGHKLNFRSISVWQISKVVYKLLYINNRSITKSRSKHQALSTDGAIILITTPWKKLVRDWCSRTLKHGYNQTDQSNPVPYARNPPWMGGQSIIICENNLIWRSMFQISYKLKRFWEGGFVRGGGGGGVQCMK